MPSSNHREYTVGWICALPIELVAAEAMLDERYEDHSSGQYSLGRIGPHNIVMACLPAGLIGTNAAATVATKMVCQFPSIRFGLMVGIGGGIPSEDCDIRLGDVVVSQPRNGYGGVVQYDFGKTHPGEFEMTGFLNAPPAVLLDALPAIQAKHLSGKSKLQEYLHAATHQLQFALETTRTDMLFEPDYDHIEGSTCEKCSKGRLVMRTPRHQGVAIHYGTIASGNQVMRDGSARDSLSSKLGGVLCFEMEAAGLMNSFPCLVIRGICDYADSHKNKAWQPYAAITAAAYAKEVLTVIPGPEVTKTEVVDEVIKADMVRTEIECDIDTVDLDWFLSILPVAGQAEFNYHTPPLDCENSEYCWVFRNLDFLSWDSASSPGILWLSGPPECHMRTVASFVLQRETGRSSKSQRRVLHYFFSPVMPNSSPVAALVRALAYQIVSSAAKAKQAQIVRIFLRSILSHISKMTTSDQFLQCFTHYTDGYIHGLLLAADDSLWAGLWAIIPTEQNQSLSVVITGLEFVRDRPDLIATIRKYVEGLHGASRAKIMLTSGIDEDTSRVLQGLPHIEYDKERKECLSSFSFANTRLEKIVNASEGTFEWLWEHPQYKNWSIPGVSSILLIEGKPGSGKSTLTKYFNEHMLERQPAANPAIVAKFFYSYRDGSLQRSHHSMLRSLLYDIMSQDHAFFYHIQSEYRLGRRDKGSGAVDWDYDLLKRMLKSIIDCLLPRPLYLIIDAVDESDDEDRRDIIKLLFQLGAKKTYGTVKIFVASRPVVQLHVRQNTLNSIIRLQEETVPDISRFARSMLGGLNVSLLLDKATKYIIDNANGVFQWVKLVGYELEASLEDGESEDAIFQRLKKLPTELNDLYQLMLETLDNKPHTADSITMFQSVFWAARPVTADELLQAVAVSNIPNTESMTDEALEMRIPPTTRITHCGGNFLELKESNGRQIVQIMHQTVREFFLHPDGYAAKTKFVMCGRDAIARILRLCIQYLILCARYTTLAEKMPAIWSWSWEHYNEYASYLNKRPFVSYALSFVEQHGNSVREEFGVSDLRVQLNQGWSGAPFVYLLEKWVSLGLSLGFQAEKQLNAALEFRTNLFYAAATNGYHIAVEIILATGTDVNLEWEGKRTALSLAAERGHEAVVNILLARSDIQVNSSDETMTTPLAWSAKKGHEAVITMLLARHDIEANSKDRLGMTPLSWAAMQGHLGIVTLLLAHHGINVNSGDIFRMTPLSQAASGGHLDIVTLLLARHDIDANSKDLWEKSPLMYAAQKGHAAIVNILHHVEKKANSNDFAGKTPLMYAAENGHDVTVSVLLARGEDVNIPDERGITPLMYAAENGHDTTVSVLLAHGGDASIRGEWGGTPLMYAARGGHAGIVKSLLPFLSATGSRDDMVPEALCWAIEQRHHAVTELLFDEIVNMNKDTGWTPLHWAAQRGSHDLVKVLICRDHVDINKRDHCGKTPLSLAAQYGHVGVAQLLLACTNILADTADMGGWSPIWYAVQERRHHIVKLFVSRDDVDFRRTDYEGRTLLDLAVLRRHTRIERLLRMKLKSVVSMELKVCH